MICPKCHTVNDDNEKFCKKCGFQLNSSRICPECGLTNDSNSKYCKECGTVLTPVNTFRKQIIEENTQKSFFNMYKIPIICGLLIVLAVGAVAGMAIFNGNSPGDDSNAFIPTDNNTGSFLDDLNNPIQAQMQENQSNLTDDLVNKTNDTNDSKTLTEKLDNKTKNTTKKINQTLNKTKKSDEKQKSKNSSKTLTEKVSNKTAEKAVKKDTSGDSTKDTGTASGGDSDPSINQSSNSGDNGESNGDINANKNPISGKDDGGIIPIQINNDDSKDSGSGNASTDTDSGSSDSSKDSDSNSIGIDSKDLNDSDSTGNDSINEDDSDNASDVNATDDDSSSNEISMSDVPELAKKVSEHGYSFSTIDFNGKELTKAQCIYIFSEYIANKGGSSSIELKDFNEASSPSGDDSSHEIEKSEYTSIANKVHSSMNSEGSVPNSIDLKDNESSEISPNQILELFTKAITKGFPDSVEI